MAPAPSDAVDRTALLRGGVTGVVALLVGYVATYVWKAPAVADSLSGINAVAEFVGGQAAPTWKAVAWLFLNAHLVATRLPALGGGARLVNLIDASDDGSLVLLYALVPVVLLLAGAAAARYGQADRPTGAAVLGATVAVGYLPAAVLLALVSGHTFGGDLTVAPDLLPAVAVAGVGYLVLLGGAGGALWSAFASALGS